MFHFRVSKLHSRVLLLWVMLMYFGSCRLLLADGLSQPSGPVVLTVTGNIQYTNAQDDDGKGKAEFDCAMLEAIGTSVREMETAWTSGRVSFEGVIGIDLLNAVGASGDTVTAMALNDYVIDIPASDFKNYPVMLALKMDGEYMRIRDKGPLWVIYPQDEYPELDSPATRRKWVWQLNALHIK